MESSKRFAAYIWLLLLVWGDHHSTNGPLIESHKIICLFCPLFLFLQWYKLRVKEAESCRSAKKTGQVSSRPIFSAKRTVLDVAALRCMEIHGTFRNVDVSAGAIVRKKNPSFPTMLSCRRWDTLHVRGDSWDEAAASHAMIWRLTDRWPVCLMGSYQAGADRHSVRSLNASQWTLYFLPFFYVQVLIFDYIRLLNFFGIPKFPYEKQIRNFVFRRQNTNDMIR